MKYLNWITRDFIIKFSSLVLSFIVWMMVQKEVTTTKTFHKVPYHLKIAANMVSTHQDVRAIKVTLTGPQEIMRDMSKNPIQITHDLKGVEKPGSVHFSLSEQDFTVPARTQILDFQPHQINVVLDELVEKELPVKVQFLGKPEKGFRVKDYVLNPTVVRVAGPKQELKERSEIETDAILLTGRTRSFVQTVALKPLVKKDLNRELQHVDVYVKLEEELPIKTFEQVPLNILQGGKIGSPVRFSKPFVKVTVEGTSDLLEKMRDGDLKAYVDITDLKTGKYQLPVNVVPLSGVTVLGVDPQVAEVDLLGNLEVNE